MYQDFTMTSRFRGEIDFRQFAKHVLGKYLSVTPSGLFDNSCFDGLIPRI